VGRTVRISLVVTVLNEAESIDTLLASIAEQTQAPDEIVVVDGGSSDGTAERVRAWAERGLPVQVHVLPGSNISQGRNAGIARSTGDILAVTDAGVRLVPGWLERLTAPFRSESPPDVVCGFFRSDPATLFELVLGATTLPLVEEIDPQRFLPSSRSVAFTRSAWQAVGGYPEWLDYCEDLVFDLALKRAGFRFAWAPEAVAYFRPRRSLRSFFRQYYLYARGDGKADLWRHRHAIRYGVYLAAPFAVRIARQHPLALPGLGLAVLAYLRRPLLRLWPHLRGRPPGEKLMALGLVPVIRLTGDIAKMLGYPAGVWWRLQRRIERFPRPGDGR